MSQAPALLESAHDDCLDELLDKHVLEELDYHFARTMAALVDEVTPPEVLLGLALAARAVGLGHLCADLKALGGAQPLDREGRPVGYKLPATAGWVALLARSSLVSPPEEAGRAPLVLDRPNGRLYLARYWAYQHDLARLLGERAGRLEPVDGALLSEGLTRYFGNAGAAVNHQRLAALIAVLRNFSVISGGPGTGKTTTVTRILALLIEQRLHAGQAPPKILLLAPTGKAAARLGEAIKQQKDGLSCAPEVLRAIPDEGATIHRIMGWVPERPTRFDHHGDNPLHADVVLVDEASMVDAGLMAKLVRAVPARARLILLGDKDQLASVEAGAVLGDITDGGRVVRANVFSAEMARYAAETAQETLQTQPRGPAVTGIWDSVVHLTHSYRFNEKSGIGRLARAVQQGRGEAVLEVLRPPEDADLLFHTRDVTLVPLADAVAAEAALNRLIEEGFRPYLEARDPAKALAAFDDVRLLCAHRHGPMGVEQLNVHAEKLLDRLGLIRSRDPYYAGRPVMVTRNDYQFNLFNGDIGIILKDPESGRHMAFFPTREGPPRKLAPGRLPPHETVYAMTVHKSQGSEFNHVGLLLPPEPSPVITRELIYTAITRARRRVTLFGNEDVLLAGIKARIQRASGLHEALWGAARDQAGDPAPPDRTAAGWKQMELF